MGKASSALAAILAGASLAWTPSGLTAPAALAQADRAELVQGLEAQFEVALIRERKLADDREAQMIGALEVRLKQARAAADAAKGDAQAANAALAAARSDYAKLAAQVSQRDASAQTDIAAYASQAQSVASQASPELAAALQRFADGYRPRPFLLPSS